MRRKIFRKRYHTDLKKCHPDYMLMAFIGILVVLGLFILFSASSIFSYNKDGNTYSMLVHQITAGLLPGLFLFFLLYKIDYHLWQKFYPVFLFATFALLLSVFIAKIGNDYGTAQSWISFFGISFQPSEVAKFAFILFLAGWFESKGYLGIRSFSRGFIPFVIVLGAALYLIKEQPDVGTMVIFGCISIAVYFIAGARISHLGVFAAGGSLLLIFLAMKSSYIANRFLAFLYPNLDTQGISYHINQALLAIGSGGFFGRGFGKSQQKFAYLPQVYGDSIFAVAAEEMGFVIACVIVILVLLIIYRSMRVAVKAPDPYGRLIAAGIISWFAFQSFINISVMIRLIPMTGVPFPFISYGGTALAINLAAFGILLNISKQTVDVHTY